MTSTSSKALPYIGILATLAITIGTFAGYGDQIDKAIAALQAIAPYVLPPTMAVTLGGLVNKALEVRKEISTAKSADEIRDIVARELENAKTAPTKPSE